MLVGLLESILVLDYHSCNGPVITLIQRLVVASLTVSLPLPDTSLTPLVRPTNQVQAVVKRIIHHAQRLWLVMLLRCRGSSVRE